MQTADLDPGTEAPLAERELVITVVGAARLYHRALRDGYPARRRLPRLHALARGNRALAAGVCREVLEPERLVFTFAWEDTEGRPGHETVVTVSFAKCGAKTKLTLHQAVFETVTARDLHHGGWASALDCLAEYLAHG